MNQTQCEQLVSYKYKCSCYSFRSGYADSEEAAEGGHGQVSHNCDDSVLTNCNCETQDAGAQEVQPSTGSIEATKR